MDTLFWRGPSDAVADRRKMERSQRRVEEGGFEGGGVGEELKLRMYFAGSYLFKVLILFAMTNETL